MVNDTQIQTQENLQSFFKLCSDFHKESRKQEAPLDYERIFHIIDVALTQKDKFFVKFKIDDQGEFVGMFIGYVRQPMFNNTLEGLELAYYVRKDHRGSPWFVRTLRTFEKWCKSKGASSVRLLPNAGINTKVDMYEKLGYEVVGYILHKDL